MPWPHHHAHTDHPVSPQVSAYRPVVDSLRPDYDDAWGWVSRDADPMLTMVVVGREHCEDQQRILRFCSSVDPSQDRLWCTPRARTLPGWELLGSDASPARDPLRCPKHTFWVAQEPISSIASSRHAIDDPYLGSRVMLTVRTWRWGTLFPVVAYQRSWPCHRRSPPPIPVPMTRASRSLSSVDPAISSGVR